MDDTKTYDIRKHIPGRYTCPRQKTKLTNSEKNDWQYNSYTPVTARQSVCYSHFFVKLTIQLSIPVISSRFSITTKQRAVIIGADRCTIKCVTRTGNWRKCTEPEIFYIHAYMTNLVCYAYFHWLFNPECQHTLRI